MENNLSWAQFEQVDIRKGTIIKVEDFPEARKPAWKLRIDFGDEIGIKRSSAQIKDHYTQDELLNKEIMAVVNFPPKQIGPFISECLVLGFYQDDNSVILARPDKTVKNGARLG